MQLNQMFPDKPTDDLQRTLITNGLHNSIDILLTDEESDEIKKSTSQEVMIGLAVKQFVFSSLLR